MKKPKKNLQTAKKRQDSKSGIQNRLHNIWSVLTDFCETSWRTLNKQKSQKFKNPKNRKKIRQSLAPRLFQEYLKLETSSIVISLLLVLLFIIFGAQISRQNHSESLHKEYSNLVETAQRAALINSQKTLNSYVPQAPTNIKYQEPVKSRRPGNSESILSLQNLNVPRNLPPGVKAPTDFSGAVKMVQKALAEGRKLEEVMAG